MSLDTYAMAQRIERDRLERNPRITLVATSESAPHARRHPLVAGLGRGFNRLGDYLQGIPATPVLELAAPREPEHATG